MNRAEASAQLRGMATTMQHPVVVVGVGMVVVQVLFRTWMLAPGWFYTDDYVLLSEALRYDLGLEYLFLPENGHLMPATRLIYWILAQSGWLNWPLAVAIAVVLQMLASLCAIWMLVTLFGRRWWILAPLAIYLTTAITAQASLWWVSVLNQTPVQIALFLAVGCWVHYLCTGSYRWLVGTVGALIFSFLFFQKGLLILIVLVYLMLAYFATGGLVSRVRDSVRRHWQAAVVVGGVSGAYLAYNLSATAGSGQAASGDWWDTFSALALRAFPAGIVGGPNGWSQRPGGAWADPSALQLVLSWTLILAVVATSIVLRRRAGRAWLLLVIYYLALATTISVTRSGVFGFDIALAYRLQTEGAAVAILALALAFLPLLGAKESSQSRAELPASTGGRLQAVASVALAVVCINGVGNWAWFARDWHAANDSKPYVSALHDDVVRIGKVDLDDQVVPASVLSRLAAPNNTLSEVAPAILGPDASFPHTTARLVRVSPEGQMYQAVLAPAARSQGRPKGVCGWRLEPGSWTRISMRAATDPAVWWVRLGYLGAGSGEAKVRIGGDVVTVQLKDGLQSVFIRTQEAVSAVYIGELTSDVAICLDTIEVGTPQLGARL